MRRARFFVCAALLTAGVGAAPASASPATAPLPRGVELSGTLRIGETEHALVGQRLVLRMTFPQPEVAQVVRIRWRRSGRTLSSLDRTVQPGPGGDGVLETSLTLPSRGSLRLTVGGIDPTAAQPVTVGDVHGDGGARLDRAAVRLLRWRLKQLGFLGTFTPGADAQARAVLAFQKVAGLARTGRLNTATVRAIARREQGFTVRFPEHGRHIEADLRRQVLAEILPGGVVRRVYPVSSGKPSTPTVRGHFSVYRREPGTNSHGMVDTSYFTGGYAIHGYPSVPSYAASHGCLRVFIADAKPIYDWVKFGTRVDVYG